MKKNTASHESRHPLMQRDDKNALKAALTATYHTPEEIVLILRIVGIPTQQIQRSGSAAQIWSSVLEEADTLNLIPHLIAYELERHPHNETIQTLAQKYPASAHQQ